MATVKEALRRVYHDLVVRRSTVRVVPAAGGTQPLQPPIFVIGVYRSGTTLVRYVLDSHSHICCPPESDFVAALSLLQVNRRYRLGLEHMGFDEEHVLRKSREFCQYFFGIYATSLGKPRWADKSPSYVDYVGFLFRLFPEARFVMLYRHGLDQAHSYTRGGTLERDTLEGYRHAGEDLRIGAVRYWREKVKNMLLFEEEHAASCFHIRYEDLCAAPEERLRALFAFLDEPWEPQVLEFYRFPHDVGAEDGRAAATRGFSLSAGHYRQWPPGLVEQCVELAEPALTELGYEV